MFVGSLCAVVACLLLFGFVACCCLLCVVRCLVFGVRCVVFLCSLVVVRGLFGVDGSLCCVLFVVCYV